MSGLPANKVWMGVFTDCEGQQLAGDSRVSCGDQVYVSQHSLKDIIVCFLTKLWEHMFQITYRGASVTAR